MNILDQIQKIRLEFKSDLQALSSKNGELDQFRIKYLGRKGLIADIFNQMSSVGADERPQMGKELNQLKIDISKELDAFESSFGDHSKEKNNIDLTLPGDPKCVGSIHPLTNLLNEIKTIFMRIGFSVFHSPEIDTDFYNFSFIFSD
mgnify:CR=1 FL=1